MVKIVVGSHFFKVVNPSPRFVKLCLMFSTKYVQMGYVREHPKAKPRLRPVKVYGSKVGAYREYRFHIGQFQPFIKMVRDDYVPEEDYKIEYLDYYEPVKIDVKLKEGWVLKDYQEPIHGFILTEEETDNKTRLVTIQTGKGKTFIALSSIASMGTRTVIIVLAMFMEKWGQDIVKCLTTDPKRIVMIQGSSQLKGVIDQAKDKELTSDFVIISLTTFQNYIKAYEEDKESMEDLGYGCNPDEFFRTLGVGTLLIDEVHMQIYSVFKTLVHTHVRKFIALSATLITRDPVIETVHKFMFPREIRYNGLPIDKFKQVYAIDYEFSEEHKPRIRTMEFGAKTYSHTAFEKSIMKYSEIKHNYLIMVDYIVNVGYIDNYVKGDKLAVYAASIDMCDELTNYLKVKYPNLDVRRYCEDDPYENVIDADIRVSTILSSGTAVDIPGLVTVIMTTNIDSPVSNLQTLGRLRKIDDRDTKFFYIYSSQLQKQVDFHNRKKELFAEHAIFHKELKYNRLV